VARTSWNGLLHGWCETCSAKRMKSRLSALLLLCVCCSTLPDADSSSGGTPDASASSGGPSSSGANTSSGNAMLTDAQTVARDSGTDARVDGSMPIVAPPTDCSVARCAYVTEAGSGNKSGSDWSNAFANLPQKLIRGTVYFLAAGIYPGRVFDAPVSGTDPITIKKAIDPDHGSAMGWQSAYSALATFTSGLQFKTSYWIVDGQTGGGAANGWKGTFGFKIAESRDDEALLKVGYESNADHIGIRHVDLHGKGSVSNAGGGYSNDGLAVYGSSDITLAYFHMVGVGRCPFFLSGKTLVAEHGWVESYFGSDGTHSELASIWGFEGNVGDATFRYNLFTDIQSTGGLMWDNSSNKSAALGVYGNVFYKRSGAAWDQGNGLIGGWKGRNGEAFHTALVYNNTFVNVDQASLSGEPDVFSGNVALNNLFYNSQAPNFEKFGHDNNHFINSGAAQGEPNGSVSLNGDPFVNAVAFDFRLKAPTNPGVVLPAPFDRDPLGKVRSARSRGAFDFVPTP
jgi:hypothetical protein